MRAGDGDAEADVEMMPFVSAIEVLRGHELLARREEEGADIGFVPDVVMGDKLLQAVATLAQKLRVLAAVLHHPFDEGLAALPRRRGAPVVSARHIGQRGAGGERRDLSGRADDELTPVHGKLHSHWLIRA